MKSKPTVRMTAPAACVLGSVALFCAGPSVASPTSESGTSMRPASYALAVQDLNLVELEQRLRDTRALSIMQKLALQKEVDELLARVRIAHEGGYAELAALRRPYEKLLANLQGQLKRDPQLAREIAASRDAIWDVLADRSKFASL